MKRQSFVPIFALIAVAVFMGVMGVSSFVLQNNKSSLTYKTRAAEGDGPGGQCTGCGGEDGCRSWEKCEGGSCQDTTNGGASPASADSCGGGGGGGGGEDPNACPCDKKDTCYNGKWCGNDCKFHDDNAYRCSANQPTVPPNAPSECTTPESCVPPGTGGGRWCGNDWKFHDELNYKCQPVPPTPAGSTQCTNPESCQNERWCGNDYSYHDDLNYIKGCKKKLTGIGANSYCANHDECASGFCLNNNCAEKPTPTPLPTAVPLPPYAPQVSETPTVSTTPKIPTADIISPSQCPYSSLSACGPECNPVECGKISTIPNCYYCPTDYQTTLPPQQSQSACTGSFSTSLLECTGLCGEKCRSHPNITHCYYCPLDFSSDASDGSQATCPDTKIYNSDDRLDQVIDCVKGQAPKYISKMEYERQQTQEYASNNSTLCTLEKMGTPIKADETHCFKCVSLNNLASVDISECQTSSTMTKAPAGCAPGSAGVWIGTNCDDVYRGKPYDESRVIASDVPTFVLTPVGNCKCEQATHTDKTTFVYTGSNCDSEMRGASCDDYAADEYQKYQKQIEVLVVDNNKESLESKMAICKTSRCMGTGTCLPTPDETDVKCYPFSTTQKDSTIPDDCGDTGQQCCTSESTTAGYARQVITNTTSFCVSGRSCIGGRCLPDPNYEKTLAVAEELRQTKSMTADQRNNFIINNLGADKKTTDAFAKIAENLCGDTCITGACVYSEKEQKYTCVDEQKIKKYFQTEYANPENEGQRGELDGPCISRAPGILAGGPKCNSSMLECKSGFCQIKSKEIETRFANDILVKEGANSETTARGNLLITGNSTTAELMSDKKFAAPGCTERDKLFSSGGACWVCVDEKNKIMNQVDFQLCDSSIKSKVEAKLPGKGCHSAGGYCAPQTTSCNGAGDANAGDCVSEFKCCMPDEKTKNLIGQTIGLGLGETCGDEMAGGYKNMNMVKSCSSGLKCFEKRCQEETTLAFNETYQTQRGNIIAEKIPVLGGMIAGISASGTREYYRSQTVRGYYADSLATTAVNEMQSADSSYLDKEKQDQIYSSIMQQSADSGARGQILARKGNLNGAGKAGLSASNWANTWNGNLNVNDVTDVVETEQYLNQQIKKADGRPEDVDTIKKQLTTLRFQAGMNIGLAAVDVVGTVATLGGSSVLTKAGTTVAGQGVKLAVKEVAKEGVELAAKEGARAVAGRALIATGRGIEYAAKGAELVDKSQLVVFGGAMLASSVVMPAVEGKSLSEIAETAPSNLLPGMKMVIGTQLGGKIVSKTLGFALPSASRIADDALLSTGLKKYSSERIARDALQEATEKSLGKSLTEAEVRESAVEIAHKQITQLGSGRVEKNVWEAMHPQGGATTLLPIQQAIEGLTQKSELAQVIQKAVPASVSQDQIAHLQQMAGTGVSPEVILKKAAEDTSADGVRILGNTMEDRIAAAKGFVEARKIAVANAPAKLTSAQQSSLISGVAEIFEKAKGAGAPVKIADAMDVIAKKTEGQLSPSSIFATVKEIERSGAGIISGTGIRDVLSPNGIVNRTVGDPPNPLRGVDTSAIRATQEFIDGKFDDLQSKFGLTPEQKIALQEERIAAEANAGLPAQHALTPNNIKTSKYVADEFDTLHPEASAGKPVEVRSREDLARQVLHDWNMLDPAKGTAQAIDNFTDPIQISKALQYADELLAQNKAKLAGSVQKVVGGAGQIHILPDQAARIVPQMGKDIKINGAGVPASGTFLRKGDVVLGGETALVYKGAGQLADQTAELAKKLGTTADQLREGIKSGKFTSVKLDSGASYIVGPKNNGRVARAADSPGLFGGIKDTINERFGVQLAQARAVAAGTTVPAPPQPIISRVRQTVADVRQSLTNTIDNLRNRRSAPPAAPPAAPVPPAKPAVPAQPVAPAFDSIASANLNHSSHQLTFSRANNTITIDRGASSPTEILVNGQTNIRAGSTHTMREGDIVRIGDKAYYQVKQGELVVISKKDSDRILAARQPAQSQLPAVPTPPPPAAAAPAQARAVAAGTTVPAPPQPIISRVRQTVADVRQSLTNTIDNLRNRRSAPPAAPPAAPVPPAKPAVPAQPVAPAFDSIASANLNHSSHQLTFSRANNTITIDRGASSPTEILVNGQTNIRAGSTHTMREGDIVRIGDKEYYQVKQGELVVISKKDSDRILAARQPAAPQSPAVPSPPPPAAAAPNPKQKFTLGDHLSGTPGKLETQARGSLPAGITSSETTTIRNAVVAIPGIPSGEVDRITTNIQRNLHEQEQAATRQAAAAAQKAAKAQAAGAGGQTTPKKKPSNADKTQLREDVKTKLQAKNAHPNDVKQIERELTDAGYPPNEIGGAVRTIQQDLKRAQAAAAAKQPAINAPAAVAPAQARSFTFGRNETGPDGKPIRITDAGGNQIVDPQLSSKADAYTFVEAVPGRNARFDGRNSSNGIGINGEAMNKQVREVMPGDIISLSDNTHYQVQANGTLKKIQTTEKDLLLAGRQAPAAAAPAAQPKTYAFGRNGTGPDGKPVTDEQLSRLQSGKSAPYEFTEGGTGKGAIVTDRGSGNGVTVNGQRIAANTPQSLASGDVVSLGNNTHYRVTADGRFEGISTAERNRVLAQAQPPAAPVPPAKPAAPVPPAAPPAAKAPTAQALKQFDADPLNRRQSGVRVLVDYKKGKYPDPDGSVVYQQKGRDSGIAVGIHKGRIRTHNEDSVRALTREGGDELIILADGMGGHAAGEVASKMIVDTLPGYLDRGYSLPDAIQQINADIFNAATGQRKNMGSTISVVQIQGMRADVYNIGDSPVYLVRRGQLIELSTEHSNVAEMVKAKVLTKEQAFNHPNKNVITQKMGNNRELNIAHTQIQLQPGDVIMTASDGIEYLAKDYGKYQDSLLKTLSNSRMTPAQKAQRIIEMANAESGEDNISVVIRQIPGAQQTNIFQRFFNNLTSPAPARIVSSAFTGGAIPAIKTPKKIIIGRDNGLYGAPIGDDTISKSHAELYEGGSGSQASVTDLDSLNGTYVNDVKIGRGGTKLLQTGDVVSMGKDTHYRVQNDGSFRKISPIEFEEIMDQIDNGNPGGAIINAKLPEVDPPPVKAVITGRAEFGSGAMQQTALKSHGGVIQDHVFVNRERAVGGVADGATATGIESAHVAQEANVKVSEILDTLRKTGTYAKQFQTLSVQFAALDDLLYKKYEDMDTYPSATMANFRIDGDKLVSVRFGDVEARIIRRKKFAGIFDQSSIYHLDDLIDDQSKHLFSGRFLSPLEEFGDRVQASVREEDGIRHVFAVGTGVTDEYQIRMTVHQLQKGDRLIYASDGLSQVLSEKDMNTIVSNAATAKDAERALIDAAIRKKGVVDDYGVVVVFHE